MADGAATTTPEDPDGPDGVVRWPWVARIGAVLAVVAVVGGIVAAVVAAFVVDRGDGPDVVEATAAIAPTVLSDGRVAWAERTTGRIVVIDPEDPGDGTLLAEVPDEVATEGQRGLLGLTSRDEAGTTVLYASWVRADDGRLVVGRLVPDGPTSTVWLGPVTADLSNGGTIVFRGDELLIGIGELQDPDAVEDPDTPNGKVLSLDPAGPAAQTPGVVLAGWHNPFALTVLDGEVWLLDNAPGSAPERIVRIPATGSPTEVDLPGRAPSWLTPDGDGGLLTCGYVSGTVERIPVPATGASTELEDLGEACTTGVVVTDTALVTVSESEVRVVPRT